MQTVISDCVGIHKLCPPVQLQAYECVRVHRKSFLTAALCIPQLLQDATKLEDEVLRAWCEQLQCIDAAKSLHGRISIEGLAEGLNEGSACCEWLRLSPLCGTAMQSLIDAETNRLTGNRDWTTMTSFMLELVKGTSDGSSVTTILKKQ